MVIYSRATVMHAMDDHVRAMAMHGVAMVRHGRA